MPTFNDYRNFTKKKAATFTNKPTTLELQNLPKKAAYRVVARNYRDEFVPHDKSQPVIVTKHGVILDRNYYNENKNNPQEIKQAIIHELAHQAAGHAVHNEGFRKVAKTMGVDPNHQKPYWQ